MKKLLLFLLVFLASCTRYVYVIMPTKEVEKAYPIYSPSRGIDDGFFKLEPNFDLKLPHRIDCMPTSGIPVQNLELGIGRIDSIITRNNTLRIQKD